MLWEVILDCLGQYLQYTFLQGGKKRGILLPRIRAGQMLRVFFLEILREFQTLVGKPLHLFEMLGECKKLNQTLPVRLIIHPPCLFFLLLTVQRLLTSFPPFPS